jgi:hypothetical protein
MNERYAPDWFVGDLGDPWVANIADAMPAASRRFSVRGTLPDDALAGADVPRTVVLHRSILTVNDADWVARFRARTSPSPRIVLCAGPYVRYADLQRWSALFDEVLPEATAAETVARHLLDPAERVRGTGPRLRVHVVSSNYELRHTLADACAAAGYPTRVAIDWSEAGDGGLNVWDVPLLEPGWTETLAEHAVSGPVLALLGFADRRSVADARAHGASACLELPCDLDDLIVVLDRLASLRAQPGHEVPPPPAALRRQSRAVAAPGAVAYNS